MTSIKQCIEEVEAVREAASDPKAAYVIRSRLERLLLSCRRVVAEQGDGGSHAKELIDATDALFEVSSMICRPSESLDSRWEEGWARIEPRLHELEATLRAQAPLGTAART
jgi:hypothetical protein